MATATKTRKVTAATQKALAEAVAGTNVPLAAATTAYRNGSRSVAQTVADLASNNSNMAPTLSDANAKQASKVAKQAEDAKAAKVAKPRVPRTTAAQAMLTAAEAGGWAVTELALDSDEAQALRMLNPHRGVRNWVAKAERGQATVYLSTLLGHLHGSVHADRCQLVQGGVTTLLEMRYEIEGTLRIPATKDGLATIAPKRKAATA